MCNMMISRDVLAGPGGAGETGHRPWVERDGLLGSGNRPPPQGPPRLNRAAENQQLPRPFIKVCLFTSCMSINLC